MSAVAEPHKLKGVTPSFPGDMPPERIPEKYRLGRGFVPKARYLDPEFQALELDKLFTRTWLMVCREEEISRVGSYVEYELGAYSIVVIRDATDSIKAYYNSCRHRGTRLVEGCGRVGTFICPFHGWRWNLDGSDQAHPRPRGVRPGRGRQLEPELGSLRHLGRFRLHQHGPRRRTAA